MQWYQATGQALTMKQQVREAVAAMARLGDGVKVRRVAGPPETEAGVPVGVTSREWPTPPEGARFGPGEMFAGTDAERNYAPRFHVNRRAVDGEVRQPTHSTHVLVDEARRAAAAISGMGDGYRPMHRIPRTTGRFYAMGRAIDRAAQSRGTEIPDAGDVAGRVPSGETPTLDQWPEPPGGALYASDYTFFPPSFGCVEVNDDFHFCDATPAINAVEEGSFFSLDSDCESWSELIHEAWSIPVENLDLVEESMAKYGNASEYDNVRNLILNEGFTFEVDIECVEQIGKGGAIAKGHVLWNYIELRNSFVTTMWNYYRDAAGSTKKRACVVCDLAATLFHEILHLAGVSMWDNTVDDFWDEVGAAFWGGQDYDSYRIENYFRYYIMKRYYVLGYWRCNWYDADPVDGRELYNWELLVCDERQSRRYFAISGGCIKHSSDPSEIEFDDIGNSMCGAQNYDDCVVVS